MASADTLFATTRLTLGLSHHLSRSPVTSSTKNDDVSDRRKRRRSSGSRHSRHNNKRRASGKEDILTPGRTRVGKPLTAQSDQILLANRYVPIAVAGDGAFSRTILAEDTFDPGRHIIAIKAMKPGFERIGQQVLNSGRSAHMS